MQKNQFLYHKHISPKYTAKNMSNLLIWFVAYKKLSLSFRWQICHNIQLKDNPIKPVPVKTGS